MIQKSSWIFYITAALTVTIDQITKAIARANLANGPITIIRGLFDLDLTFNSGAAFGLLPDWAPLFIVVALVAVFAIVRLRRAGSTSKAVSLGLGLLLGGAIGNLIDRIISPQHWVTDFIKITIPGIGKDWPTFNIADVGIVVGAILVVFYVYMIERGRVED